MTVQSGHGAAILMASLVMALHRKEDNRRRLAGSVTLRVLLLRTLTLVRSRATARCGRGDGTTSDSSVMVKHTSVGPCLARWLACHQSPQLPSATATRWRSKLTALSGRG